jgi:CubicO group peptidase (beta-lactamase class C family)
MKNRHRKWMRLTAVTLFGYSLVLAGLPIAARAQGGAQAGLTAEQEARIAKMLADSGAPSVSVAVVEDGKLAYAKAFGKAELAADRASDRASDRAGERAADVNTRYAIGSVSKQFTVAAILWAQEQAKLSLDDKVAKYFPNLTRANEVTIRELLSHTSGYSDYAPQDYMIPEWTKPTNPDAIINEWATKPLDFDPGTRWQYSNTNFVLAGKIFEKATGTPLMDFLASHVFQPLGMTTAGDCSTDKRPGDAVAYTRYGLGPARVALREGPGWYFAAGELCMTPSDLAKWDISFLQKRILSAKSYEEFSMEVPLKNGDHTGYALGLSVGELDDIPQISHSGEVSGFLALNSVFPTRDAAVIVLSNQDALHLIGPVGHTIARWILEPEKAQANGSGAAAGSEIAQVRGILEGLQKGEIDRSLLTSNLSFYYTPESLGDIKNSLAPLGALKSVTRAAEELRGGMTFRAYRVQFEKGGFTVTVYLTKDGHYEQFLIEEDV